MPNNDVYVWYSNATDVTGQKIADKLDVSGGVGEPTADVKTIICWGTKTLDTVILGNARVLNHPDKIRTNRHKGKALATLEAVMPDNIAKWTKAANALRAVTNTELHLPLIGRRNYHQGGKGFWTCLTKTHIEKAITFGSQYFQEYIDISEEYRLHVFKDKVVYAQKKQENGAKASWIAQRKEKIVTHAADNNINIHDATIQLTLERLVKEVTLPDFIVRSNTRGWKFARVGVANVSAPLSECAIKSVEALGLDFGAVDCAIDTNGVPFIIEVNTGPGLQRGSFDVYIAQLEKFMAAQEDERDPYVKLVRNVRSDEEARAVIDAIMKGRD